MAGLPLDALDDRLPGLPLALDPAAISPHLAPLCREGTGAGGRVVGVDVIKHRAGRRCALAYTLEGPRGRARLFAKLYAKEGRGARVLETMRDLRAALPQNAALGIPEGLAYLEGPRMLVTSWVEGPLLAARLLAGRCNATAARRAGAAAAALHGLPVRPPRTWSASKEIRNTGEWIDRLPPVLAERGRRLLGLLERAAPKGPVASRAAIHRDFYPEQMVDAAPGVVLLDWDDVRHGDPAVDLGNFLAHLRLRVLQQPRAAAAARRARQAFIEEYARRASGGAPDHIPFYEATTLLRLASVYAARQRWTEALPAPLLDACSSTIEEYLKP